MILAILFMPFGLLTSKDFEGTPMKVITDTRRAR
jgi:hypothetical protein